MNIYKVNGKQMSSGNLKKPPFIIIDRVFQYLSGLVAFSEFSRWRMIITISCTFHDEHLPAVFYDCTCSWDGVCDDGVGRRIAGRRSTGRRSAGGRSPTWRVVRAAAHGLAHLLQAPSLFRNFAVQCCNWANTIGKLNGKQTWVADQIVSWRIN